LRQETRFVVVISSITGSMLDSATGCGETTCWLNKGSCKVRAEGGLHGRYDTNHHRFFLVMLHHEPKIFEAPPNLHPSHLPSMTQTRLLIICVRTGVWVNGLSHESTVHAECFVLWGGGTLSFIYRLRSNVTLSDCATTLTICSCHLQAEKAEAGQRCAELQAAYEAKVRAHRTRPTQPPSPGLLDFLAAATQTPPCVSPAAADALRHLCHLWTQRHAPADAAVQTAVERLARAFAESGAGGDSRGPAATDEAAAAVRQEVTRLQRTLAAERSAAAAIQEELRQRLQAAGARASPDTRVAGPAQPVDGSVCTKGSGVQGRHAEERIRQLEERIRQLEEVACEAQAEGRRAAESVSLVRVSVAFIGSLAASHWCLTKESSLC
jgi:hypothetical protein